ncbi:MAG: iron ABC transporter permease, partial [Pseudomonadota bacterium]
MSTSELVNPLALPFRRGASVAWPLASIAIFLLVLSPIAGLMITAFSSSLDTWQHLINTVLPRALQVTLLLMLGVSVVSIIVGAGTAWLVTLYRFPGQGIFKWLLVVPLAMPTYLAAFCYVEIWDYSGWVQSALRASFGFRDARDYWFPDIRTLTGAIFVMGAVLYPYVYLTARASFVAQSASVLEASRTLGCNAWRSFWRVGLPLARPAIAAGAALAMMECLNDIGAVQHFGVNTLTVLVYDTWLERGSLSGAAQIACAMLVAVILLFALERFSRRQQQFHQLSGKQQGIESTRLTGWRAFAATLACLVPVLLGFGVPGFFLIDAAAGQLSEFADPKTWQNAANSFVLSFLAACLAMGLGLIMVFARRLERSALLNSWSVGASIGYAVPGKVLAIGFLITLAALESV